MVILLGLPPIIIGCINFFAPTLMVLGVNEGSGMSGVMNMYYGLPKVIQTSIIVFPMCLFIGRMFAWLRVRLGKPKQECPKARKKRILKEYGYTKMPEWH